MPDAPGALLRAKTAGVRAMLLAGVDPDDWQAQRRLVSTSPDHVLLFQSYGIHPQWVALATADECAEALAALRRDIERHRPAAIGEIGLDAYTAARKATLPLQDEIFAAQLRLAKEARLPVCLHILAAHGRALEILRREGVPDEGGMVHSYSGSGELVRDYLELGLHLSFTGSITLPNARKSKEAVRRVPDDRLLLETDSPDQTPARYRPALNEPAFLANVVEAAAELRGQSVEQVAGITYDNAMRLLPR